MNHQIPATQMFMAPEDVDPLDHFPQVRPNCYDIFAYLRELGGDVVEAGVYFNTKASGEKASITAHAWIQFEDDIAPKLYGLKIESEQLNSPACIWCVIGNLKFQFAWEASRTPPTHLFLAK